MEVRNIPVFDSVKDLERYAECFVRDNIELDSKDSSNRTLLMSAVTSRSTRSVDLLVKAGASVDLANGFFETPLFSAARLGHETIVEILIKAKANIDLADKNGNTPLKIALDYGHASVAEILIEAGADPNKTNELRIGPLFSAIKGNYFKIVKSLIQKGANVNTLDKDGNTPLTVAVRHGYFELVRLLLSVGAFVNVANIKGITPIFYAVEKECPKIVEVLLKGGANVNFRDTNGNTPLYFAFVNGNLESMKLLLEAEADVKAIFQNRLALFSALQAGLTEVIDTVMFFRPLSEKDWENEKNTLFQSVAWKNYECSKSLIRHFLLFNPEITKPYIIEKNAELSEYWNDCKDEILSLQIINAERTKNSHSFSLLTFLREKNINKLANYYKTHNFELKNLLKYNQFSEKFPIYRDLLANQIKIAKARSHLLHQCFQVIRYHWKKHLPSLIFLKIISLLSFTDLLNLSKSGKVILK